MNKTTGKSDESASGMFVPEADYLRALHAVTQHWLSDVKFFEDELSFFRLLIDKHLVVLIDQKNIQQTRSMVTDVISLEKDRSSLFDRIILHSQHIADLVENPFVQNIQRYKEEHARLEIDFSEFVKKFRLVKVEVFKITEKIIRSDKGKHMVDWA